MPAPSPHGQAHCPGGLGSHLETLRSHARQSGKLADNGAQATVTQRLFKTSENGGFILGFKKDDLLFGQAGLRQSGRKQIGLRVTPKDLAAGARHYSSGE